MAGGSTAPTDRTDKASHVNPEYDSDENGLINAIDQDAITETEIAADEVTQALIATGAVGGSELSFDPATQAELDGHAGATNNPHNVTDDQTGASNALSNHAGNSTAHHSKPSSTNQSGSGPNWVTTSGNDALDNDESITVSTGSYCDAVKVTIDRGQYPSGEVYAVLPSGTQFQLGSMTAPNEWPTYTRYFTTPMTKKVKFVANCSNDEYVGVAPIEMRQAPLQSHQHSL